MLSEADVDLISNGLLKPLQVVSEQLVSLLLGDGLPHLHFRAAMAITLSELA